jgi:Ion channel
MLKNLLIALPVMIACLLVQSLLVIAAIRFYRRHHLQVIAVSFWPVAVIISSVMLLLIVGNLAQVALWAALFLMLGEFQVFADAFYHSGVNFGTLGYGDFVMSAEHKLLGPLEAIHGALMIGVSTATLLAAFQDAMEQTSKTKRSQ